MSKINNLVRQISEITGLSRSEILNESPVTIPKSCVQDDVPALIKETMKRKFYDLVDKSIKWSMIKNETEILVTASVDVAYEKKFKTF